MAQSPPHERKAPGAFDAFKLARERGSLEGVLDVETSDRLYDRLAEGPGTIKWRIEGTTDRSGRPALAIANAALLAIKAKGGPQRWGTVYWCGREDSNFHRVSPTSTSSWRVYHSAMAANRVEAARITDDARPINARTGMGDKPWPDPL